ncbi:MAG: Mur ligase family protein [Gaiellaceae bacterium]|jgi:dihydrofolate synthase/folylpolyglutamate synthase
MPSPADAGAKPNTAWLASLSPWPERFGLERIQAFLAELGNPERSFRSIHIVGTNGKTTTCKRIEALLVAEGARAGATISPHVRSWSERISVNGSVVDLERALGRVRPVAEALAAMQFEVVTAAAFSEFAAAGVEVAAVEAGLGGRYDATNVIASEVVVLTNVALEHTQWLGSTREAIAREKLAVIAPGAAVVLGEGEWEAQALEVGAGSVTVVPYDELPRAAVELLLGRSSLSKPVEPRIPGRLEWRHEYELWDGAHNPAGIAWLVRHLAPARWTVVCSILADKDVASMLRTLAPLTSTLLATSSSNARALPAAELAVRAEGLFETIEVIEDPALALARGRELAAPSGHLLVTGSLYLLADLAVVEEAVH